MRLDVSPLEKALGQLEKSLAYHQSSQAAADPALREQFRAAVIQAFEFTFELAVKMIRRQLAEIVTDVEGLRELSFMELMRTAFEAGLVRDAPAFRRYRESRNVTSHTYHGGVADSVLEVVGPFAADCRFLLEQLRRRQKERGSDD